MPFNPNRINIHELTIEEPEKPSELPFDPERDITEEDWEKMSNWLEDFRGQYRDWDVFSRYAMEMKILGQTKNLNLDQTAWQGMKDRLENLREIPRWGDFFSLATGMKILDQRQNLNLDQAAWQGMQNEIKGWNDIWKRQHLSLRAMDIKILYPAKELGLNQANWQTMRDGLEEARNNNWRDFSHQAAAIKVLDPKADLGLDEAVWQDMRDELEACRKNGGWGFFCSLVMDMKILAADEVKVTENGLEITMRKPKLTSGVPPMPETKKF